LALHTNPSIGPAQAAYDIYALQLLELEPGFGSPANPPYVVTLRIVELSVQREALGLGLASTAMGVALEHALQMVRQAHRGLHQYVGTGHHRIEVDPLHVAVRALSGGSVE
jgi:hypothetical protein